MRLQRQIDREGKQARQSTEKTKRMQSQRGRLGKNDNDSMKEKRAEDRKKLQSGDRGHH